MELCYYVAWMAFRAGADGFELFAAKPRKVLAALFLELGGFVGSMLNGEPYWLNRPKGANMFGFR